MRRSDGPPGLLTWIMAVLAPSHLREDLLGDLEEQFRIRNASGGDRAIFAYGLDVLRLFPFLFSSRLTTTWSIEGVRSAVFAGAVIVSVSAWEALFVQKMAWPLTADLMTDFAAPGRPLFFSVYAVLHVAGMALIAALYLLGRSRGLKGQHALKLADLLLLGTALSGPVLFNMIFPQALDSALMRFCLLGLIWSGMAGLWIGRGSGRTTI